MIATILNWLRSFTDWIRKRVTESEEFECISYEKIGDNIRYLIYDSDLDMHDRFPGITKLYLISNADSENDLMLIMINIQKLGKFESDSIQNWQRQLEIKIRAEIERQHDIAGTHLFIVAWITKRFVVQRNVNGRDRAFKYIQCTKAILFDCVGTSAIRLNIPFDRPSKLVLDSISYATAIRTKGELNTWEQLIRFLDDDSHTINWHTWLDGYVKKILRDPNHEIQPKKSNFKRSKYQN